MTDVLLVKGLPLTSKEEKSTQYQYTQSINNNVNRQFENNMLIIGNETRKIKALLIRHKLSSEKCIIEEIMKNCLTVHFSRLGMILLL